MELNELMAKSEPKLKGLNTAVEYITRKLIEYSHGLGVDIRITEGYRSIAYQNELYAQGRTKPGNVVTNAKGGTSWHNYGLAVDFVLVRNGYDVKADGNNNGKSDWMEVVAIAKTLGFEWGGDFESFVDKPHFQLTFGLTIGQAKAGRRPTGGQINAVINNAKQIEQKWRDKNVSNENEVLKAKLDVATDRIEALEKRLNIKATETYATHYKEAVDAALNSGLITTVDEKSKIELNIIQMLHNAGITNKAVINELKRIGSESK